MAAQILVVDDDPSMRDLLRMHLESAGYEVRTALDAIDAGHQGLKDPPALMLLDVDMPHMDGFEFLTALKSDKTLPNIPVIILTSMEGGEALSKELGAVGYMKKPVRADRLLQIIALHVPGGSIPIG